MAEPIVLNIQIMASKSNSPKYTNHGIKIRMAGPIVLNIQIIASKSEWLGQ